MNSFFQSDASEAKSADSKNFKLGNFKLTTAALAIGTIGAVTMSLVLASAAMTFGDYRIEDVSSGSDTPRQMQGRDRSDILCNVT